MSDESKTNVDRINVLISELEQVREDGRNAQNQIISIISLVITVLGILLGATFFGKDSVNAPLIIFENLDKIKSANLREIFIAINELICSSRLTFVLSVLIFGTAFAYIAMIGIDNVIRYYYIQDLQDRICVLEELNKDDNDRGRLLRWNEFTAPIATRNIKHITSSHTMLYYILYTIAVLGIITFSMSMILAIFFQIEPIVLWDKCVLGITFLYMGMVGFMFVRLASDARNVAQFLWDTAHENQEIRLKEKDGEMYKQSTYFRRIFKYFLYPKSQDPQKPLLILLGSIFGGVIYGADLSISLIKRILFVIFVFDVLGYQARYQINDIRGIDEDKEAGSKNRLLFDDVINPAHTIKLSFDVAIVKILLALILALLFDKEIRNILLFSLLILLLITLLYEYVRLKEHVVGIFVAVGMGYPLRFLLGYIVVLSDLNTSITFPELILLSIVLWAYGAFSSIISWTNQIMDRMQISYNASGRYHITFRKKHFQYICNYITLKYNMNNLYKINNKVILMRDKGYFFDPWNVFFIISMITMSTMISYNNWSRVVVVLEVVMLCLVLGSIVLSYKWKLLVVILTLIIIILKIFLIDSKYCTMMSLLQICIIGTYSFLAFQPQVKKIRIRELMIKIKYFIIGVMLGKPATDILDSNKR